MRTAVTVSVIAHALLWGINAFSAPHPTASPGEAPITVDIVSADEIGLSADESGEAAKPVDAAVAPADQDAAPPPQSTPQAKSIAQAKSQPGTEAAPPTPRPPAQPAQRPQRQQPAQTASTPAPTPPPTPTPQPVQAAPSAATPAPAEPRAEQKAEFQPDPSQFGSSWLDSALSSLPVSAGGYEESEIAANLSQKDIAAFKAHLQKCWSPPAGLADDGQLMTVLRVPFKPNGTLAGEPVMLAASASANGPLLLQAAVRALRACQPYRFLPAAKYSEWKVLDLSFSPAGLSSRPAIVSGFDGR